MMVYRLAYELHKTVDDIRAFTPTEFERWVAFFQIQDEVVAKRNKTKPGTRRRGR